MIFVSFQEKLSIIFINKDWSNFPTLKLRKIFLEKNGLDKEALGGGK